MGTDVSITFDGELSGIRSRLDELNDYVQHFGENVKGIGEAAFGAWGAEKIFEGLKEGLHEIIELTREFVAVATQAAQVDAQLDAALVSTGNSAGFTAGELSKMAEDLQRITTYGHDTIKTAETLLLRFTEIKGDQFKQATELALDMAKRMGGDAAGAANDLGRALNNPLRGMMLMEREGHTLTQSQQEVIQALVASGQKAEAQNVLLAELSKMYGGAAAAAAQASGGGFAQVANRLEDLKETIGKGLIPLLDELAPAFKFELDEIEEALKELIGTFTEFGESVTNAFGTTAAEKLVGAIAIVRHEIGLALAEVNLLSAMNQRAGDLFNDPISFLPIGERANANERALDKAREKVDSFDSDPTAAAMDAIKRFRESVDKDKADAAAKEKDRADTRANSSGFDLDKMIDPNLLAFTKVFPGLTANIEGLKKFGDQMKEAGGTALQDAGKVAGAIAAPLVKTFTGIGNVLADTVKPMDGFTSKLESAAEMFNRIQSAAASTPTQDKALEAAQKTADQTFTIQQQITNAATTLLQMKNLMTGKVIVLG